MFKKLTILLVAAVFSLGVAGAGFTAQEEVKGLITEIEVNKLTVLNDTGQSITVTVEDLKKVKELKVGDKVVVKDGKVIKEPGS